MSTDYPVGTIKVLKVNPTDNWSEEVLTPDDVYAVTTSGGDQQISGTKTFTGSVNVNELLTVLDLTVQGVLTVTGSQVILNTEELLIEDNIIVINSTQTGTPVVNGGLEVERGSSTNARLLWDESTDKWKIGLEGSESNIVINPIIENLLFTPTDLQIKANTTDGSDTKTAALAGGNSASAAYGGFVWVGGNESALAGKAILSAGGDGNVVLLSNSSSGDIEISPNNPSGGRQVKFLGSTGNIQFTPSAFGLHANTSDGSDNKSICIAGGGGLNDNSRGSFITLRGNEFASSPGTITIGGGNVSNGHVNIITNNSTSDIILSANNPVGSNKITLKGSDGSLLFTPSTFDIKADTSDGSDTKHVRIGGGGDIGHSRGAFLILQGNEVSDGGNAILEAGSVTSGTVSLVAPGVSGSIILQTGGFNTRWQVEQNGHFTPGSDDVYDIGTSAKRTRDIYSTGGIQSFTGEHLYQIKDGEDLSAGEAVSLYNGKIERCAVENDSSCVGILDKIIDPFYATFESVEVYDSMHQLVPYGDLIASVAAVGDNYTSSLSGFKVCNENGNISSGDLLVTSSGFPGHLKKQEDSIIRNYTVGKSLQNVTFDSSPTFTGTYGIIYCG